MQQALHLLIVESSRREVMVTRIGRRWLLPVLSLGPCVRAGPLVRAWLAERGVPGDVAGQWLGRATRACDAIDWLVVINRRAEQSTRSTFQDLEAVPLESLVSSDGVVDYQRWAVAKAMEPAQAPCVPGPFGSIGWLEEVCVWMRAALQVASEQTCDIVAHRTSAYEVVLEFRTPRERYFFKGLSHDRAHEAEHTSVMSRLAPGVFPETRATETRADGTTWWLMEACPGSTLSRISSRDAIALAAIQFARVQQRLQGEVARDRLGVIPPLNIEHLASWAKRFLKETSDRSSVTALLVAVEQACELVRARDIPCSWVAGDLDPTNVLIHGDHVRFIDLDSAFVGPPPLAIATLARRASWRECLYEEYERAWSPRLRLEGRWWAFEIVSLLVECEAAWNRVLLKTRRGEIHGIVNLARAQIGRRIERALTGSSQSMV